MWGLGIKGLRLRVWGLGIKGLGLRVWVWALRV